MEGYECREIWTRGRKLVTARVMAAIFPHRIVATADPERITPAMALRALRGEFPNHTFYLEGGGGDYMRFRADRWTGDGLE